MENSLCISLADDKTQQSSSPPPWIRIVWLQIIPKIYPIWAKHPLRHYPPLLLHNWTQSCPGPVWSAGSADQLWIVFPFNTSDKDFQHHSWDEDSFQCCTQSSGHNRLSASWSTSSKYDLRLADEKSWGMIFWLFDNLPPPCFVDLRLAIDEKNKYLVFWLCDNLVSPCFVERWCELDRKLPQN